MIETGKGRHALDRIYDPKKSTPYPDMVAGNMKLAGAGCDIVSKMSLAGFTNTFKVV